MRIGHHSEQFQNNFSEEENRSFTQEFGALTTRFAECMKEGVAVNSDQVQDLVREHYQFCAKFWKPTREAYKSLAMSYILPSPYRDSYESVAEGLGQYHYDAIVIWADKNLE